VSRSAEDKRRRSDRHGRFEYTCAHCGRPFLSSRNLGSMAGNRVSVCGAVLSPSQARCLLADEFGKRWWPEGAPMPDLLEIQRWYDQREAEAEREEP